MKKSVCIVTVVLMLLCSVSAAFADEIRFRDIPWGSNVPDVLAVLPSYSASCDFEWESRVKVWSSVEFEYDKPNNGEQPTVAYYGDIQVAGYDVNTVSMGFLFTIEEDGTINRSEDKLSLYTATYELKTVDKEAAFTDLIDKLTHLYGNGKKDTISYAGQQTNRVIWYGENDTGVCLLYNEYGISISYGLTTTSYIDELDDALAREEKERAVGNTNGL